MFSRQCVGMYPSCLFPRPTSSYLAFVVLSSSAETPNTAVVLRKPIDPASKSSSPGTLEMVGFIREVDRQEGPECEN